MKVCLIVDNPLRDLDGLTLVAAHLARAKATVYLVPMYLQRFEVPRIAPDFVLMNFARVQNIELIKEYSRAGMGVGVLDTEGGIWESPDQYVRSIAHEACAPYIDLYCLWGSCQYDALRSATSFKPQQLVVTGCPRYDVYAFPWKQMLDRAELPARKPFVLIATNFCLVYPRYASGVESSAEDMRKAGYGAGYVESRINSERTAKVKFIAFLEQALRDFPELTFVLRPHPFEDEKDYLRCQRSASNLRICRERIIAPWVHQARHMVHLNSSTAVDAYMLGKVPITLDWILDPIIRNLSLVSYQVSRKAASYQEFKAMVSESSQGKSVPFDAAIAGQVEQWFHRSDGKSAQRVAEAVIKVTRESKKRLDLRMCRMMSLWGAGSARSAAHSLDGIARRILSPRIHDFLRTWVLTTNLGKGTKHTKFFSLRQVNALLREIAFCAAPGHQSRSVVLRCFREGSSFCITEDTVRL